MHPLTPRCMIGTPAACALRADDVHYCGQVDRNEDMIRSALRAVDAIAHIPNVDACAPFKHLLNNVVLQGALANKYKAVREERAEAEGVSSAVGK